MRVATQPSVTAGEGQPHGQLQRKARAPTPGVGPHLLLINCGGLLPRLVTGPGSWGWSFQRSAVASHFQLPGCCPSHWLPFGGQAGRRWKEEEGPEKLKLRWEGLQRRRRGQDSLQGSEQPRFPYIRAP